MKCFLLGVAGTKVQFKSTEALYTKLMDFFSISKSAFLSQKTSYILCVAASCKIINFESNKKLGWEDSSIQNGVPFMRSSHHYQSTKLMKYASLKGNNPQLLENLIFSPLWLLFNYEHWATPQERKTASETPKSPEFLWR